MCFSSLLHASPLPQYTQALGPIHALTLPDRLLWALVFATPAQEHEFLGSRARTIYNTVPNIHWEPSKGSVEWLLWILLHLLSYIPWVLKVFILIITKIDSNPLTYYGWLWLTRLFMGGRERDRDTNRDTDTEKAHSQIYLINFSPGRLCFSSYRFFHVYV